MNRDRIVALIILILGIGYLLAAISLPSAPIGDPLGPKAFPIVLGGLMILLGATILIGPEKGLESHPLKRTFSSVFALAGLLGGYGYTLPLIGYPLGTFLFLFITARMMGERSWILCILLSVGLSLGIYLLFTQALGIPLPLGVMEKLKG